MIYLLDTNAISDLIVGHPNVTKHFHEGLRRSDSVGLCQPVYYEILRGLFWKKSPKKLSILRQKIIPRLDQIGLQDEDWLQAAYFWADTVRAGKQLADMDLLIAAVAYRLNAIIVSSDTDFDSLPVHREDWRLLSS